MIGPPGDTPPSGLALNPDTFVFLPFAQNDPKIAIKRSTSFVSVITSELIENEMIVQLYNGNDAAGRGQAFAVFGNETH